MEKEPARIFVLWHPDFTAGREIAKAIFNWFRTPDGHGIPVYFRSAPGLGRDDNLPVDIPDSGDSRHTLNLIILLAEYHMVRDRNWHSWIQNIGKLKSPKILYPVALHRTAYHLPDPIRKVNFIRIQTNKDYGDYLNSEELEELLEELRKSLTEALSRALTNKLLTTNISNFLAKILKIFIKTPEEPPKIKIFISHAKRDRQAVEISKRIRDYIYQETQLSAFFDENDIALGYRFGEVLNESLKSGVAAMIAVNSDSYAARPWCRREVQVFSQPFHKTVHQDVWLKSPLLVLQAMHGGIVSSAIPDFGNAPMIRWREGDESQCIDTLLRESIFRSYHAALASIIRKELIKREKAQDAPRRVFINWVPDPLSLNNVVKKLEELNTTTEKLTGDLEIVYPGGGLSFIELHSLRKNFPQIRLRSFSEMRTDWGV